MNKKYTSKIFLLMSCGFGLLNLTSLSYADDMNSAGLSIVGMARPNIPTQPVNNIAPQSTSNPKIEYQNKVLNSSSKIETKPISMEPIYSPGDSGYQALKDNLSHNEMPSNMVAPVYVSPRERRNLLKKEKISNVPSLAEQIKDSNIDPQGNISNNNVNSVYSNKIPNHVEAVSSSVPVASPIVKNTRDGVRIWHVSPRHTVNDILADWGEKAGWTVAFKTNQVYEIEASADFEGDFISAASSLLKSVHAEPRFKAVFHSGNKVLVVGNTFQQVE